MSDRLAAAMAPHVSALLAKTDHHDHALELAFSILERSGAASSARMQLEHRQLQRRADAFHRHRPVDDSWRKRMTTSRGAALAKGREALTAAVKQVQRVRDNCSPGSEAYHAAHTEFLRLTALASAA